MAPPGSSEAGKLGVTPHYNQVVPITLHKEMIMIDITGTSTEKGKTVSIDLVVVLDTSGSMQGQKLHDMKIAAMFVIQKIGHLDTLTFVPFSDKAWKPSAHPPPHMSDSVKYSTKDFVTSLKAHGNTNIQDGLLAALRILHDRTDKRGRPAGIFLMSDGWQNVEDARDVDVHDFPVFTFGFGDQHDKNSEATILQVEPGKYRTTNSQGCHTIHYGELARTEQRKILVVIQLPAVHNNEGAKTVLVVDFSYRLAKERESTQSLQIAMSRDRNALLQAPSGHFKAELARRDQAQRIGKMKRHADAKDFGKAIQELAEAKNALRIVETAAAAAGSEHSAMDEGLLDALSMELEHLEDLLESHEEYSKNGAAYVLAAMLSHERQRFAARGGPEDVMLFAALPRMVKYARQADEFHRNPNAAHI